jgi:hypothetical protein
VKSLHFLAKKELTVRHPLDRRWKVTAALPVVALLAASLSLAGCSHSVTNATCTTQELIKAAGKAYTLLPPSHDNDAGKARIPDTKPDADIDANQRAALCRVYKSEIHLPG